jgi:ACR3 family arsenite efflux pump ArsB
VQYFVIIFANSALVGAAMIRLRGGDPTVGDGFRIAMAHLGKILGYALVSATVGMILRWLSERGKTLGRIASSIGGLAWNLATYLVVPVLVIEDVGPLEAIRRSANLLKKTWGEQIVGNFSIGLIFGLLTVLVILLGIPTFVFVASTNSVAIIALTALLFVLILVFLGLVSSTLNGIYVAAVYRYAAEGEASGFFSEEMVRGAFRPK